MLDQSLDDQPAEIGDRQPYFVEFANFQGEVPRRCVRVLGTVKGVPEKNQSRVKVVVDRHRGGFVGKVGRGRGVVGHECLPGVVASNRVERSSPAGLPIASKFPFSFGFFLTLTDSGVGCSPGSK